MGCPWMLLLTGVGFTQHQPAATSVDNARSCSYSDLLLMMGCPRMLLLTDVASQQQHRWTMPEAVVTVICSDDGRKHRPKHAELIKVNKSKWLLLVCYQFNCNLLTVCLNNLVAVRMNKIRKFQENQ